MSNYTIRCIGFELQQQASIVAILDLAGSALKSSWDIVDHVDSDVMMIKMNGEVDLKNRFDQQEIPDYRIIWVAEKAEQGSNDYWFLAKKEYGPPSLRELVQLLNQVDVCLHEAEAGDASEITEQETENESETDEEKELLSEGEINDDNVDSNLSEATISDFSEISELETESNSESDEDKKSQLIDKIKVQTTIDLSDTSNKKLRKPTRKLIAKNYLFGLLIQAKKDKGFKVIKLNKLPVLYLSIEKQCFYFAGEEADLLQFCTASSRMLSSKNISETKFNKLIQSEVSPVFTQGIDALIGYAIVIASQGRLIDDQLAEQIVKLKQMPDTNQIPALAAYSNISELMMQQESNLFDVAEQLQVPLSDVFNFYNICYFFGYIKVIAVEKNPVIPETEKNLENKNTKTLGHFLSSFFNKGDGKQ